MDDVTPIGVDLAKKAFRWHGAAGDGLVVFCKKLPRARVDRLSFHTKALVKLGTSREEFEEMLGVAIYMGSRTTAPRQPRQREHRLVQDKGAQPPGAAWSRGDRCGTERSRPVSAEAPDNKTISIDATYFKAHRTASSLRLKKGGVNV